MPTLIRESTPTARKTHRCQMCAGQIQPGETYTRGTWKYDDLYDFITCAACETDKVTTAVYDWCGGPSEGVTCEDAFEWGHEDDSAEARAWLVRFECDCERCKPEPDDTAEAVAFCRGDS